MVVLMTFMTTQAQVMLFDKVYSGTTEQQFNATLIDDEDFEYSTTLGMFYTTFLGEEYGVDCLSDKGTVYGIFFISFYDYPLVQTMNKCKQMAWKMQSADILGEYKVMNEIPDIVENGDNYTVYLIAPSKDLRRLFTFGMMKNESKYFFVWSILDAKMYINNEYSNGNTKVKPSL